MLVAGLSGCGSAAAGNVITVNTGGCGTGWHQAHAGMQTFQISNSGTGGAEVDLINPANGAIYAEVDQVGPGTTAPMRVDLGSGRYAFRCLIEDTDTITGPAVRIGGHQRRPARPGQGLPRLRDGRADHAGQPGGHAHRADPGRPPRRGPPGLAARTPDLRTARRRVRDVRELRHG